MLAPAIALLSSISYLGQSPNSNRLITVTLDQAIRDVFPDKSYSIEYGSTIQDAPVVYSIRKRTDPKSDFRNFCAALFLDCDFDESKKTVKVTRSRFLSSSDRKSQINRSISNLQSYVRPVMNLSPKDIYRYKSDLEHVRANETDASAKKVLDDRISAIGMMLRSEDAALMRSLMGNNNIAEVLAAPCTPSNYAAVTADAVPLVNQFFAGKGIDQSDYLDSNKEGPQNWATMLEILKERKDNARKLGEKKAIAIIKHVPTDEGIHVGLYFITADEQQLRASITIPIDDSVKGSAKNVAQSRLDSPVKPKSLWESDTYTINSLGTMADDLDVNFASWLSPYKIMVRDQFSFKMYQKFNPGLSIDLNHDWLSIYSAKEPMTMNSKAWKPFLKLRDLYESKTVTRKSLLETMGKFSETDLNRMEDLGAEFEALPRQYGVLTSGIRLYKAYLSDLASRPENSAFQGAVDYGQLPADAKKDFLGFFTSAYIWNSYTQLFHSDNKPKYKTARLTIGYKPNSEIDSDNYVGISFPQNWNPVASNSPIRFPIKPGSSKS